MDQERWEVVARLAELLEQHPDAMVVVVVARVSSRNLRLIVDRTLRAQDVSLIRVKAFRDRRYK